MTCHSNGNPCVPAGVHGILHYYYKNKKKLTAKVPHTSKMVQGYSAIKHFPFHPAFVLGGYTFSSQSDQCKLLLHQQKQVIGSTWFVIELVEIYNNGEQDWVRGKTSECTNQLYRPSLICKCMQIHVYVNNKFHKTSFI